MCSNVDTGYAVVIIIYHIFNDDAFFFVVKCRKPQIHTIWVTNATVGRYDENFRTSCECYKPCACSKHRYTFTVLTTKKIECLLYYRHFCFPLKPFISHFPTPHMYIFTCQWLRQWQFHLIQGYYCCRTIATVSSHIQVNHTSVKKHQTAERTSNHQLIHMRNGHNSIMFTYCCWMGE